MKIILNVGSIDILHGHDLIDMHHDFIELVTLCDQRHVDLTITTIAPLANVSHKPDGRNKICSFNRFLVERFSATHRVIDIYACMVGARGETLFDCYQP